MKLFGGKRNSHHTGGRTAPRQGADPAKSSGKPKRKAVTGAGSGKKRRLTGLQRGLLLLLAALVVLAGVVVGVYKALVRPPDIQKPSSGSASGGDRETDREPFVYQDDDGNEVQVQFDAPGSHVEGYYNILLLGTDDDGTRTDTIMIARLDTSDHSVALMSIPRDTLINGNYSVPKINSVYGGAGKGEKGVEALKKQLTSILGFEVDGYVLVDLRAFVEIVDIVGGVPFDVPQNMYYNDPTQDLYINLSAGQQVLDGEHAMQLVRYRKYAEADIQRTKVQQDFIRALAQKCLSFQTITKIKPIVETCIEYVQTDLTLGNMLYFAQELLKCDLDQMETFTLPGNGVWINGGSYYALYAKQVLEIVNENFNPYDADIPLSSLHIRSAGSSSGNSSGSGTSKPPAVTVPQTPPEPAQPEEPDEPDQPEEPDTPDGSGTAPDPEDPDGTDEPADPALPEDPAEPAEPSEEPEPVIPIEPSEGDSNGADILDPGTESPPAAETPEQDAPPAE